MCTRYLKYRRLAKKERLDLKKIFNERLRNEGKDGPEASRAGREAGGKERKRERRER